MMEFGAKMGILEVDSLFLHSNYSIPLFLLQSYVFQFDFNCCFRLISVLDEYDLEQFDG